MMWAAALVALFVLAGTWYLAGRSPDGPEAASGAPMAHEPLELVTANGARMLSVEVARTPEQQAKGLMFRNHLADDRGMLFPHDKPREVSMWMRNTYIPLDMVFLKSDGTVHRIAARTEPLSEKIIASQGEVSAVLELAGGAAERLGLKPGDKVRHPLFKP
jgi:uncharacterized membrane protein (UPF0127 family)